MNAAEVALQCNGLTRSFGDHLAVDNLSLSIEPGSVLALLGHNGAGKTTAIRLLNGILAPDAGSASVLGLDPSTQGNELRRRTGVITEIAGLDDRLTARENLTVAARLRGRSGTEMDERITLLLDQFGMSRHRDSLCRGFSTGQRRRVALARALVSDPELLFLDEPTSGLDPAGSKAVLDLIADFAAGRKRTVVLCTHFLAEASQLSDYMCVMQQGRSQVFGRPNELASKLWPHLEVRFDLDVALSTASFAALGALDAVQDLHVAGNRLTVWLDGPTSVAPLTDWLCTAGYPPVGIQQLHKTLTDVYFKYQDASTLLVSEPAQDAEIASMP